MTGRILRGGVAALLLFLAAGTSAPAHATTFAPLSVEQFTDASTWIVEGKVTRVWTELDEERMVVWTHAELDLSEVYKGPRLGSDAPSTLVVSSIGGSHGGITTEVPGHASFSVGEQAFLFLDELSGGQLVPVSKFLGKLTVRRAPGERRNYGVRWQAKAQEQFDHRFLPHPAPEQRFYLDDLRVQVQQRVAAGWDGQPIEGVPTERLESINSIERRAVR